MESALVSVIVPVYNVERYLHECVDSIIAQTYPKLEIILVNDGSPDDSGLICERYALEDSRIKVIHKKNGGLSDARNAGLDIAKGKYISFVDSDDIIDIRFIESLLINIEDSDMCFCNYSIFYEDDKVQNLRVFNNDRVVLPANRLLSELMTFHYPASIIAWNKLYKRELWENLRYPFGKIIEDEFVIHRILDQCKTVVFINAPLYYYRKHGQSITSNGLDEGAANNRLEAFHDRKQFFIEKEMFEEAQQMNDFILYFYATTAVRNSNKFWKQTTNKMIWTDNNVSFIYKCILQLKKTSYRSYRWLMKLKGLLK